MCAEKVSCGLCCSFGWPHPPTGPGRRDCTNPTQLGRRQPPLTPQSTTESKRISNILSCALLLILPYNGDTYFARSPHALLESCQRTFPTQPPPCPSIRSSHCLSDGWLPFSCAGSTFGSCCGCSLPGFAFFVCHFSTTASRAEPRVYSSACRSTACHLQWPLSIPQMTPGWRLFLCKVHQGSRTGAIFSYICITYVYILAWFRNLTCLTCCYFCQWNNSHT